MESEDSFERIGGSSIGGGTFWGLGALLTQTKVCDLHVALYCMKAASPLSSMAPLSTHIDEVNQSFELC